MCGLAGIVHNDTRRPDEAALRAMGDALAHRGPDDAGEHIAAGVGLASRRLAILDLSPNGHMPMTSPDGQVVLAFNGEIYNHVELREEMKRRGSRFRSTGDTEVLLQLYLKDGPDFLRRLIGMFAIALWDGRRKSLLLARDRLGVKPVLYRLAGDGIRFASEIAGLLAEPGFSPEPDPEAVHHFLALRYVPGPKTAFASILQVPPAHVLFYENGRARLECYWSLPETVRHLQAPFGGPSIVPSWFLAREVSRNVKVALVGDGGDEDFGGYDRYRAHLMADRLGWLPGVVSRTPFYALLEAISSEKTRRNLPGRMRRFLDGWELPARERNALWMANPGARRIARLYQSDFAAQVAGIDPTRALGSLPNDWGSPALIDRVLRADLLHYLPDDLLFKAHITSMAFGLELRSPFLDHRVVELAASLPASWKVRGLAGKWFLRRAYRHHIPESVRRSRKAGFGLPIDHWFRHGLHGVAHDLLLGHGA